MEFIHGKPQELKSHSAELYRKDEKRLNEN